MMLTYRLKNIAVLLFAAAVVLMVFSTAFAAEGVDKCTVRANLDTTEVRDITGNASAGAVNAGTDLDLDDSNAGDHALICTYSLIKFVTNLGVAVIVIVSIAVFLYAAFLYLTAGSGEKKSDARSWLVWGVVGLVVAFLANNIPSIVRGFLGS